MQVLITLQNLFCSTYAAPPPNPHPKRRPRPSRERDGRQVRRGSFKLGELLRSTSDKLLEFSFKCITMSGSDWLTDEEKVLNA